MATRRREWVTRVGLLGASTCLGVLGVELLARALVGRWTREPGVVRQPFARYDRDLGWSKPPNARGILRRSEYRVPLEINSHGLRGPEIPKQKPSGVSRVLLLGDSFTEGYTVLDRLSVRGRLETGLNETAARPVEVVNGGTAGWGTDQEVLFYRQIGRLFSPDLVLLLFYYNDLYRDGDLRIQPWFDLDEQGTLVLRNSPVPPHREFYRAEPFSLRPFRGSMALALLQPRLASHPRVASVLARFGLADRPASCQKVPEEFHPFGRQRPREVRRHWARLSALLQDLRQRTQNDGARLLLFYVPARFEVDDSAWSLTKDVYGLNAQWDRNRVAADLSEIAQELDLPLIDPRAALRTREGRGQRTYFAEDGHWTEAGNEVAAEEILKAIEKGSLLPPCGATNKEVRPSL